MAAGWRRMKTSRSGGRAEKELVRGRNMLGAVVENIPETLIVKDAQSGRYVFINRAGEALLWRSEGRQSSAKTTAEVYPKEQRQNELLHEIGRPCSQRQPHR